MKTSSFNNFIKQTQPNSTTHYDHETTQINQEKSQLNTLRGVLLNNHIKKDTTVEMIDSFSRELLIPQNTTCVNLENRNNQIEKKEDFNMKKALAPVVVATGATLGGILLISSSFKKYSADLATKSDIVRPGDLPRSMNLLEETDLAIFRALRDPNKKNIFGLIGVGLYTGIALGAKNLIDGIKEIWIKKQNCDITHDLQENLINVETQVFKGKLDTVNSMLVDSSNYFKQVLGGEKPLQNVNPLTFKGEDEKRKNEQKEKTKNIISYALVVGGIAGIVGLSYLVFKNYNKSLINLETFKEKMTDKEIKERMDKAVGVKDKQKAINQLSDVLKMINATDTTISTQLKRIPNITEEEIKEATQLIKKDQIYAQAPEALAGVSEKIQYYCYVNEPRGHLYNWILNPENKFNKFLFLSLAASGAVSYVFKNSLDALKEIGVSKENSKSELNLRKRLVQTEIDNFKAKKQSAINPLMEDFDYQVKQGKSKEELSQMAQNILLEIKNGPPYVYS